MLYRKIQVTVYTYVLGVTMLQYNEKVDVVS